MDPSQGFSISVLVGIMLILMKKALILFLLSEFIDPGSLPGCGRNGPRLCPVSSSSSAPPSPIIRQCYRNCCTCANGHECNHLAVFWNTSLMG